MKPIEPAPTVLIGEICRLEYGSNLPGHTRKNGTVPVYGSNGVVGYHDSALTDGRTIIIGRKGSVGEVNVSEVPCWPIDTTYYTTRIAADVDLDWLSFAFRFLRLSRLSESSAIPGINRDDIYSLRISKPPLVEQKRTAAILSQQMAAQRVVHRQAVERTNLANALATAYLRRLFPVRLENGSSAPIGWRQVQLGETSEVVSGITLGRKPRESTTRRVPYLRVANVKEGYLDLLEVKQIDVIEAEFKKWRLQRGDILLTEGGDPDKLGRGTYWSDEIPDCIHQNHIFRVRFDPNIAFPPFVAAQLGSPYGKEYFLRHAKQTTGIASINQKVLRGFPLLLPSVDEQRRISSQLEEHLSAAETLREESSREQRIIERIPAAFLRRAFSY